MPWELLVTEEFERWWDALIEEHQDALTARIAMLRDHGPALGRPMGTPSPETGSPTRRSWPGGAAGTKLRGTFSSAVFPHRRRSYPRCARTSTVPVLVRVRLCWRDGLVGPERALNRDSAVEVAGQESRRSGRRGEIRPPAWVRWPGEASWWVLSEDGKHSGLCARLRRGRASRRSRAWR